MLLLDMVLEMLAAAYTKYADKTDEEMTKQKAHWISRGFVPVQRATGQRIFTKATFV